MATIPAARRHDLTDAQWAVLEPLLPRGKSRVGRRNGRNGSSLTGSGGGSGSARRGGTYRRSTGRGRPCMGSSGGGSVTGPGQRIVPGLQARADAAGLIGWDVSVDSTIDAGASARRRARGRGMQEEPPGGVEAEPADHALGRSRGGRTTKVHLAVRAGPEAAVDRG